ncbi:MAG: hypothetical protein ACFE8B_08940 [Candidatus Hermodarchaeota archaeon]
MSKRLKHISRERLEASQRKLEEMMNQDPESKKQLDKLAKLEDSFKKRQKKGGRTN